MIEFLASITAQFVVTDAVVDAGERHVSRQVAFVFAVEAGQSESVVDSVPHGVRRRLRRDGREVCASRSSRLVGAVWAITVVVVDSEGWHADGRIADASERLGVFVVFGDCRVWSANVSSQLILVQALGRTYNRD